MARTVEAILKANVSGFNSSVDSATAKMNQLADAAQKAGAKVDASLTKGAASAGKLGSTTAAGATAAASGLDKAAASSGKFATASAAIGRNSAGIDKTARGLTRIGVVALAGFGLAVKSAADFDQAISHLAATGPDAEKHIGRLRTTILDLGASTQYSATEVANASEEMAKAGVGAEQQLGGGLKGALDLAAAGGLSVARAAEIAGTALKQFGLEGAQIPHVADLLAAGANAAVGSVDDLANGLKYVGPVAKGMGISIEQTVGALTEFAAAGLVGEQGGTSLRGVLLSLTSPSAAAAKEMQRLGINVYDASGKFVGIDGAAQQLNNSLMGLGEAERNAALGIIFGNTQVTAANVLMRGGAGLVRQYTNEVDQQGAAAEQARKRMDNLRGDVEKLGGALQTAFISSGEGIQSPLRDLAQGITNVIESFNGLSDGAKGTVTAFVGLVGAGALAAAGVLKIVQAAAAAKTALTALKISAATAGIATAGIAAGLVVGAIAFQHYAEKAAETRQNVSDLTDALQASNGAIDVNIAQMRGKALVESGAADAANKLGISTSDLALASLGNADAQARVNTVLAQQRSAMDGAASAVDGNLAGNTSLAKAADDVAAAIGGGNKELAEAQRKYRQLSEATQAAVGPTTGLSDAQQQAYQNSTALGAAIDALRGPLQLTAQQSSDLSQQLFAEGSAAIGASNAHIAYKQAVSSANSAIKENGRGISENTKAGRENKSALNQLAASGQAYVQSLVRQGASAKQAASATAGVRRAFIASARDAGMSARAAGKLADSYGLIPKKVTTTFDAFGLALQQNKVAEYAAKLKNLPPQVQVKIQAAFERGGADEAKKVFDKYDKTVVKPKIRLDAGSATKTASGVTKALKSIPPNMRPKITAPSTAAKKRADDTTSALRKTGSQKPAPKIKDPGGAAKKRADDTTSALKRTGAQKPAPKIKDPGGAAKSRADSTTSALRRIPKSVNPRINVTSNAASVAGAARRQIQSVDGKTVTITVRKKSVSVGGKTASEQGADGMYVSHLARLAGGGRVGGRGGKRQDNILGIDEETGMQTARVSVGEFVQPADSVDYYGLQGMQAVQEKRIPRAVLQAFADGGYLNPGPLPGLAVGGVVGPAQASFYGRAAYQLPLGVLSTLLSKVRALNNPLASLAGLVRQVRLSTAGVVAAQRNLAAVRRKAGHTTAQVTAAQEKLKTAQDKLVTSNENLGQAQASLADAIRSTSATLRDAAATTSTDPADVLAKRKETAAGLEAFNKQLLALRKAGLNDQDLTDIVARGQLDGSDLAAQILKGGKNMVAALNLAQKQLTEAADKVGTTTNVGVIRRAGGGWIDEGPYGVDRVPTLTTRGEYVTEPRSAAANAELLERINASQGRNILHGMQGFVGGMSRGSTSITRNYSVPVNIGQMGANTDQVVAKIQGHVMDGLVMTGLAGVSP